MTSRTAIRSGLLLVVGLAVAGGCTQTPGDGPDGAKHISEPSPTPAVAEVGEAVQDPVSCTIPEAVRTRVPVRPLAEEWYETRPVIGAEGSSVPLGVGHIHYSERNTRFDLPPGELDWLRSIDLPLSPEPGAPATTWITMGWIVRDGVDPEPLRRADQVETGYEEISLIVLATQGEWLEIRYAGDDGGSGWAPACALDEGSMLFDFTPWSSSLMSDAISPLFFRTDAPDELFAAPDENAERRAIGRDYHLEPIEVRDSWMRVRLKEPSDYCEFDLEVDATEGWVRWYADDVGPRLWYYTRGC